MSCRASPAVADVRVGNEARPDPRAAKEPA